MESAEVHAQPEVEQGADRCPRKLVGCMWTVQGFFLDVSASMRDTCATGRSSGGEPRKLQVVASGAFEKRRWPGGGSARKKNV